MDCSYMACNGCFQGVELFADWALMSWDYVGGVVLRQMMLKAKCLRTNWALERSFRSSTMMCLLMAY